MEFEVKISAESLVELIRLSLHQIDGDIVDAEYFREHGEKVEFACHVLSYLELVRPVRPRDGDDRVPGWAPNPALDRMVKRLGLL